MPRWFLSYHSPDRALAERLKGAIEHLDSTAQIFFAPTGLRAGRSWTRALADEIAQANGFILLIGEHGLGDWQVLEYDEALDRTVKSPNFPLVLVLLEGQTAPGLPFLRRLHWIVTPDPGSEADVERLIQAAAGRGVDQGKLWRHTSPYRGLAAMEEKDTDYFFGRQEETVQTILALASGPNQLPVLIGNSGVGKSSLARAGVLAALKRQSWPEGASAPTEWPAVLKNCRQWCFLTLKPGATPIKALVEVFLDTWRFAATDPARVRLQNGWIDLLSAEKGSLGDLLDATERRHRELEMPEPPVFFLYLDQGEELYARSGIGERARFSELFADGLGDPRFRAMMSMRSDFLGHLHQDKALFKVRRQIDVPPLGEAELRQVVRRPAELLSARFESPELAEIITRRTAEDSIRDVGALPLLSYTLDDMWTRMVRNGDGVLRLPSQTFDVGGVLVERADNFLTTHPGAEEVLQRILTLRLANVREGEEPTRRRARRAEFTDEEWRIVGELTDHPNRLLVTVTPENGETYAEVAHEAIFRRWEKLRNWIAAEREFLAWKSGLESARRAWEAEEKKDYALLMGVGLAKAQNWRAKRSDDLVKADRGFIDRSIDRDMRLRRRSRRVQGLVYALMACVFIVLVGWKYQSYVEDQIHWVFYLRPYAQTQFRPYALSSKQERGLKPKDQFRECSSSQICPEMILVPAGGFNMGSPESEGGRGTQEGPQHDVTISRSFAVAKYEVTFDEWDSCVATGECDAASDYGMGRGQRPVINVTWDDAKRYAAWLSRLTGKPYRLLTDAEYEYATRAGTNTIFYWGNEKGINNANCADCGSQWDGQSTAPVGSFAPNQFGLHDMSGNVWEWVEDCWHQTFEGAPTDGSAWLTGGDCTLRVVRGGSYRDGATSVRSAGRYRGTHDGRIVYCGFRIARTIPLEAIEPDQKN
jgi:formylglycine-generating enzyme required for sulfatase activity